MVSSLSLNVDQNPLQHVTIMEHVIRMNHVTVLIVMTRSTTVLSMELVNNSSVPKIQLLHVLLINSHTVSRLVSMVILVMRVDSVSLMPLLHEAMSNGLPISEPTIYILQKLLLKRILSEVRLSMSIIQKKLFLSLRCQKLHFWQIL